MCKFYLKFSKELFIQEILKLPIDNYITSIIINKDSDIVILMKNDNVKSNKNYEEGKLSYFKNPNTNEISINKLEVGKQIIIDNTRINND